MFFQDFERILNKFPDPGIIPLPIIDFVSNIHYKLTTKWKIFTCLSLEKVEHRQDLSVIGHKGLSYELAALDQFLQLFQGPAHD